MNKEYLVHIYDVRNKNAFLLTLNKSQCKLLDWLFDNDYLPEDFGYKVYIDAPHVDLTSRE